MAQETEIKLRIRSKEELRRKLGRMGAKIAVRRTRELNLLFDTSESELKRRDELLRIRTETPIPRRREAKPQKPRTLLTYKRAMHRAGNHPTSERHKTREELELEVSDGQALANILSGLGMREWFRYEKFRTTYRLPDYMRWGKNLLIEVDETPIGLFVEVEGPADAIDRAARELGFGERDYIVANYLELYAEHCRKQGDAPAHMVFAKHDSRKIKKIS